MDNQKKILILYASAGHGHEKAARAVQEALACAGIPAAAKDTLALTLKVFGRQYRSVYLTLIQHAPALWGFFYYVTDIPWVYALARPFRRLVNRVAARGVERFLLEEKPDVVIATHFMAVEIVGYLKKRGLLKARLLTVVTDFLPHTFWTDGASDLYAVASEHTRRDLARRGVAPERVEVTGIPIEKKFSQVPPRAVLREKLGLPAQGFAVLVTSGGAGVGSLRRLAQDLLNARSALQLLVVCGTNQALRSDLQLLAVKDPRLHVFGFVDNVQELMQCADLVIGKGGGLTVSESLSLGKPMVLFAPVPGQEARNAQCLLESGAGLLASTLPEVSQLTHDLMNFPDRLQKISVAAAGLGHMEAAQDVAAFAVSLLEP